ncbi:MAG: NADH:flavin oxidoreductase, partial [Oscillospiraceae bacterium]|nr:NADH:flavin oxidoreductase [Oscillospiraceae bacterium]
MAEHEIFKFGSLDELCTKIVDLGVNITTTEDISALNKKVAVGGKTAPNALAVLPMEGCDANPDGSPSELVERRYLRYARGGAGLIWWEACAVVPEGRANPLQKMLTKDNIGQFADLLSKTNRAAEDTNGSDSRPLNILQLTHSGRYSRPTGHSFEPYIIQHDPILDPRVGVDEKSPVVTDMYLESLIEQYVLCSKLAQEAGFDGVDIKACHRYLINELLASHTREGKYGGSFENRSRLLMEIVAEVKKAVDDGFIIA